MTLPYDADRLIKAMNDPVNPKHYHGTKVDEFIEEFNLGFRPGNAIKYIARHKEKGTPIQDLKKAIWYLEREVLRMSVAETVMSSCDLHQWKGPLDRRCPHCIQTKEHHNAG